MKKIFARLLVFATSIVALSACSGLIQDLVDHGTITSTGRKTIYMARADQTGDYLPSRFSELSYGLSLFYGDYKAMVSLNSYLQDVYLPAFDLDSTRIGVRETSSGLLYTFSDDPKGTISVDFSAYTITFSNYGRVEYGLSQNVGDTANIATSKSYTELGIVSSSKYAGYVEKGGSTTFNLRDYNLPVYSSEKDVYIPVEVANWLFLRRTGHSVVYNGDDFYLVGDSASTFRKSSGSRTSFAAGYYGGSMSYYGSKKTDTARLDANLMLFFLDHFYGFRDRSDLSSGWGDYLKNNYLSVYNGLFSTDADVYDEAVDSILVTIIGDGHTAVSNSRGNTGSLYNGGERTMKASQSQRVSSLMAVSAELGTLRQEALGENPLEEHSIESYGETGIIRFDSFAGGVVHPGASEEAYHQYRNIDNYALFVDAFRTFNANSAIKRVVIDLTLNGGGELLSCLTTLGFLMNEVPYATYNPLTGDMAKYGATVDVNADGVISGNESYADTYKFYVLTSNFSFSCGNLFPTIAKEAGITILGEKSGGGACMVQFSVSPSGQPFQISGNARLSKTFDAGASDNDGGIDVDQSVPKEHWYNIAGLDGYLSTLA